MTARILLQLDGDPHPSTFDSVVAVDSGVGHLFRYGNVGTTDVVPLVHGAMFTRGGDDLRHTAIFIGGSNVHAAESVLRATCEAFFGPIRVSVMLDANGCNTTASAAVVAASRHVQLAGATAVVLGGTGPVGQRVAQLLASDGTEVKVSSRSLDRAAATCRRLQQKFTGDAKLTPVAVGSPDETARAIAGSQIMIACGAAGAELIDSATVNSIKSLQVAIDLNAVPPAGIEGIEIADKAKQHGDLTCYGAIGIGGLKMKTHKAAINRLFESNDQVLDAAEIYAIAKAIG